jgi:cephalosporin hydroxylase
MFEELVWQADRMLMKDLVFRLEHYKSDSWELGDRCFRFVKIKALMDQYSALFSSMPAFHPSNIMELGIWDGGSVALWFEQFQPIKLVAIDIASRSDSEYFRQYVASRELGTRIKTYWATDQSDSESIQQIVRREFTGPLDLVLDDASHIYEPTKASFEILFPLLRPGGLYIIEDWAWGHWKNFHAPDHPMAGYLEPTRLVFELVEATGTSTELISALTVFQGFTVIERGHISQAEMGAFKLNDHIVRRTAML